MKTVTELIKSETKKKRSKVGKWVSTYQKSTTDASKDDCFITFDVLFINTGHEISTRTYSSWGVKFKYSDMGYSSL